MSDDEPQNLVSSDTIMAEATLWFGRMRGPEAEQHKAEFERWLARGALHRSFYNRAGEIYAMGKFLKDEQEQSAEQGSGTLRTEISRHVTRQFQRMILAENGDQTIVLSAGQFRRKDHFSAPGRQSLRHQSAWW